MIEAVLELVVRRGGGKRVAQRVQRGVRVGIEVIQGVGPPRGVGGGGLLVHTGQFPHDEPEDVGEQGVEGADGVAWSESGGAQDRVRLFKLVEDGADGESPVGEYP